MLTVLNNGFVEMKRFGETATERDDVRRRGVSHLNISCLMSITYFTIYSGGGTFILPGYLKHIF